MQNWIGRWTFQTDARNPRLEWPPVFAWHPLVFASLSQLDLELLGFFAERQLAYQRFSSGNLGAGVPSPGSNDTAFALELPGLFAEQLPAYQRLSLGNLGVGVPSPGNSDTAFALGGLSQLSLGLPQPCSGGLSRLFLGLPKLPSALLVCALVHQVDLPKPVPVARLTFCLQSPELGNLQRLCSNPLYTH